MNREGLPRPIDPARREALRWSVGVAGLIAGGCGVAPTHALEPATTIPPAAGGKLLSPFPSSASNPESVKALKACEAPPLAVTKVVGISKYDKTDPTKSKIDPVAEGKHRAETAPVTDFSRTIVKYADDVASDPANSTAQAECAWTWLEAWATQKALEGPTVDESLRKWELAALACAVIKLQRWSPGTSGRRDATLAWLRRLGNDVMADYSKYPNRGSRRSNHRYWAAWAAVSAGVATDDRRLFDWGMTGYQVGIDEIRDDGSLPLEVARGSRALGYHSFSLTPLVMMAETGEANGQPLYALKQNRLSLLIRYVLNNFADPSPLAKAAGAAQDMAEAIKPTNLVWLEPWYARTRDPKAERWLRDYRPLTHRGAGGDLTMLFGAPLPEAAG